MYQNEHGTVYEVCTVCGEEDSDHLHHVDRDLDEDHRVEYDTVLVPRKGGDGA